MTFLNRIIDTGHGLARCLVGTTAALALGLGLGAAVIGGAPALAQDATSGKPALWVVRDADSTIYLFGTVHILRPETVWRSDIVDQAFDSADQIWFEIPDPSDQAGAMPLVQRYGLDFQTPLSSLLNAEERTQLDEAAQAMGLTGAAFEPMRPWLAAMTLSVAPLTRAGYDAQSGVELVLRARALEAGKPIHGLETMEQQIQILAGMSPDAQLGFLRSVLSDYESATVELDRLVVAWTQGDMVTLEAIGIDSMRDESGELYDAILVRRNTDWAEQIDTMLDGQGVIFIAVGAAHLAGDDSVQILLEQRGHKVERLQ